MYVYISNIGNLYQQLKKSQTMRVALIRKYVCYRREIPLQSFVSWLQEQEGMHNASEHELEEIQKLTFAEEDDAILYMSRRSRRR